MGALACPHEQAAVSTEGEGPDGVAVVARRDARRERLADEDLPRGEVGDVWVVGAGGPARHAGEGVEAAGVRRRFVVDGVGEVDPPVRLEVGVHGNPEQAPVVVVEHLALDVEEWLRLEHAVDHEADHAPLLHDEHSTAWCERDGHRLHERSVDGVFEVEPLGHGLRRGAEAGGGRQVLGMGRKREDNGRPEEERREAGRSHGVSRGSLERSAGEAKTKARRTRRMGRSSQVTGPPRWGSERWSCRRPP